MSNIKYNSLYHEEIKEKYISSFENKKSREFYRSRLKAISLYEKLLDKDLFDFNEEYVQILLYQLKGTKSSIRVIGSIIKSYIKWAIQEGYQKDSVTFINQLNAEYLYSFAANTHFYRDKEITDLVNYKCQNIEEKLIILFLYEGIDIPEISNIKYSDVDFTNRTIKLSNGNEERMLDNASELLLKNIELSLETTEYLSTKGKMMYVENTKDYIVRKINTYTNDTKKVDYHKISRALKRISNDKNFIAKTIRKSGMLKYAKDLLVKSGELGTLEYNQLIKRFNIKKNFVNGYETSPYYNIRIINDINENTIYLYYCEDIDLTTQIQTNPLWKIKEQNGLIAEKIVMKYLSEIYKDFLLRKPPDIEGYDIEVFEKGKRKNERKILMRIEVKSVQNKGRTIYLTLNELQKANLFLDEYFIYLVDNLEKQYEIYVIKNPILSFNIDINIFEKVFNMSSASIGISSIKIQIKKDFIDSLSPIIIKK